MTRTNRMLSVWYDLATQEQEILIRIATRLRAGQHTYGALESTKPYVIISDATGDAVYVPARDAERLEARVDTLEAELRRMKGEG